MFDSVSIEVTIAFGGSFKRREHITRDGFFSYPLSCPK